MTEDEIKEILKGTFDIEITNWSKWHPDETTVDWVKLDVHFFEDPKISKLSAVDQIVYLRLLCVRGAWRGRLQGVDLAWSQRHVSVVRQSVGRALVTLAKSQLIFLQIRIDKKRVDEEGKKAPTDPTNFSEGKRKKEKVPASTQCIIEELEGIEDELFSELTINAQRSWVKEYGVETLRAKIPTFYQAWREKFKSGDQRPKVLFITNCLTREKKQNRSPEPVDHKLGYNEDGVLIELATGREVDQ